LIVTDWSGLSPRFAVVPEKGALGAPFLVGKRVQPDRAFDDEPTHRAMATVADARQVKGLNSVTVRYSSMEQPEAIEYN
jgi:hypothetical protein